MKKKDAKENSTIGKALEINLDPQIYGAFAEIGAGQEVARFFFQAGKASQTIAKTMSAYDMIYSDEIYGKEASGRYVCESRVCKMLDKEFSLLQRRLDASRGDKTTFFAYANTVATGGDGKKKISHGWMGVKFQTKPKGPANTIILHVRLFGNRLEQQETLGILGVNLVHLAFRGLNKPEHIISFLVENIMPGQISIDVLKFDGPDLKNINNQLMNLELVKRGLSEAVMFGSKQEILNIADEVYGKAVVAQRGSYKPIKPYHLKAHEDGKKHFKKDFPNEKYIFCFEMTLNSFAENSDAAEDDILTRVKALCTHEDHILVTNFLLYYRLKRFLRQYTQKPIALVVSAANLDRLFDPKHYQDLEGGLLEGLGKLLDENTKIYVYSCGEGKQLQTAANFKPKKTQEKIFKHFLDAGLIVDI